MKKTKLTILAAFAASASLALAGGHGAPGGHAAPPARGGVPPEVLAEFDADGDSVLSDTEKAAWKAAEEAKKAAFIAKYDANGDGVLDATERAAARADEAAARLAEQTEKFNALDTDASGGLSAEEFAAGAPEGADADKVAKQFARLDADSDGTVTLEEFTAKGGKPPKGGPGGGGHGGGRGSR
jgi:Ca2+-binding EF-hand superfamily protein